MESTWYKLEEILVYNPTREQWFTAKLECTQNTCVELLLSDKVSLEKVDWLRYENILMLLYFKIKVCNECMYVCMYIYLCLSIYLSFIYLSI